MKRWVSGAMALIITFSCAQGGWAFATEEVETDYVETQPTVQSEIAFETEDDGEAVVQAEAAEALVPEAEFADMEWVLEEDDSGSLTPEIAEADVTGDSAESRYARVSAEDAEVRGAPEGAALATLHAGGVVLLLEEPSAGWRKVAFNTDRGILTGCVAAEALRALDAAETADYMDELARGGVVALYGDSLDAPLGPVACDFPEAEAEAEAEPEIEDTPEAEPQQESEAEAGIAPHETESEDAATGEAVETGENDAADADAEAEADGEKPEGETGADGDDAVVMGEAQTSASVIAGDTADVAATDNVDTAAAATITLNMQSCVIGVKETYGGLSVSGNTSGVTWTTSNKKVVTVDAKTGVIKGVKRGSATVTATAANGKTANVSVTVKKAPKKVRFSPKTLYLGEGGKTAALKLSLSKDSASAGTAFTSSNPSVATVSASGVVTTKATGTAVITARTYNKKKATCKVIVYAEPAPSAIKLPAKATIGLKETRAMLTVTLVPAAGQTTSKADITWSSTNSKVVRINAKTGVMKALKKGKATIVAKTGNGLKAKCKVTVKKAPTKVNLQPAASTTTVGGTVQFSGKLSKGSAGSCTYTSSNPAVATITADGLAKGVSVGKTTITVTTFNGKKAKTTLTVSADSGTASDTVKVPESMAKLGIASYQSTYSRDMTNAQKIEYVIYNAQNQLGMPYKYGAGYTTANPSGFDCSGFVFWCYYKIGVELGNSAYKQGYDSRYSKITDIDSLRRGDVVCFNTVSDSDLSDHTGIYLGDGYFIHASSGSSKRKVVVQRLYNDSISSDYYKRNFSWGRRILK